MLSNNTAICNDFEAPFMVNQILMLGIENTPEDELSDVHWGKFYLPVPSTY